MKFRKPTLSALIKCHNEETFLRECIQSIQPFVDEIVLINNNSTDESASIASSFDIKIINFNGFPGGNISLADYYNWCTEQTSGDYVIKWDADMIAFENYGKLNKYLNGNIEAIFYPLCDLYGDHKHTTKAGVCGPEPYVFKRDIKHYNHHDGIERLPFWNNEKQNVAIVNEAMALHMNLKSTEKYVLREIMREYRKQRRSVSLEEWANKNYDLKKEINNMESTIIKNIKPYNGVYSRVLNTYLNKPKWKILYENGRPIKRMELSY
jgi:glycosyltransferase involved in cell wall biosynthesis